MNNFYKSLYTLDNLSLVAALFPGLERNTLRGGMCLVVCVCGAGARVHRGTSGASCARRCRKGHISPEKKVLIDTGRPYCAYKVRHPTPPTGPLRHPSGPILNLNTRIWSSIPKTSGGFFAHKMTRVCHLNICLGSIYCYNMYGLSMYY